MPTADPKATQTVEARSGIDHATVDLGRSVRCGFGEVIYGEGKSVELISEIAKAQLASGQDVLVTRITSDASSRLAIEFPTAISNLIARTLRISAGGLDCCSQTDRSQPHVAVITAGSTDAPVAAEAIETLRWMRMPVCNYTDIGVAGPQRLLARIDEIRQATVVIVVAGMEGALPSVVAGHLAVPVIAVPTSVGYGASLGGITPLLSALASCAPGVTTVGIDAGFKGGYVAGLIVSSIIAASRSKATSS
jgi:pyridinium-3,5-biscarboxylic acid mononucleotide synthase